MKRAWVVNIISSLGLAILASGLFKYVIDPVFLKGLSFSKGLWVALIDFPYEAAAKSNSVAVIVFGIFLLIFLNFLPENNAIKKSDSQTVLNKRIRILILIPKIMHLMIYLSILFIWFVFSFYIDREFQYQDFNHSITKITPYAPPQDIALLKSDWTRMKSKADYENITGRVNKIIKDNNLD